MENDTVKKPAAERPSVLMRPDLTLNTKNVAESEVIHRTWCAKYGDLKVFGDTPEEAMANFDAYWSDKSAAHEPNLRAVG